VRDPYELLGVHHQATTAEVKTAFRKRGAEHHPDRNPGDPEAQVRFRELNEAYQILSDPQKRAAFDRYGPAAFRPGGTDGQPGIPGFGGLDGLLSDLLGAVGIRSGSRGDLRKRLDLSFEEAALGCSKQLSYDRLETCDRCQGTGSNPQSAVVVCPGCGGRGRVRVKRGVVALPIERTCQRCRGSGQVGRERCSECGGRGLCSRSREVKVDVPAGIENGATQVVARAGDRVRPDQAPGDLEVVIAVTPHPFFRRQGDDVLCDVPISFAQATLGGMLDVMTLDGQLKMRVPPATPSGAVLRLRGKGVPHRLRAGRGDQLVRVTVHVPSEISHRARELIEELGTELGEAVHPQEASLVDKLKGLFR
jgi:molecular chaperone DnaJ